PTAEVEEQPLNFELGQLEACPEVEAEGHGSEARYEVESRELPQANRLPAHAEAINSRIVIRRNGGQECRGRDLLLPSGLSDALELGTQPRLRAIRQVDCLRK